MYIDILVPEVATLAALLKQLCSLDNWQLLAGQCTLQRSRGQWPVNAPTVTGTVASERSNGHGDSGQCTLQRSRGQWPVNAPTVTGAVASELSNGHGDSGQWTLQRSLGQWPVNAPTVTGTVATERSNGHGDSGQWTLQRSRGQWPVNAPTVTRTMASEWTEWKKRKRLHIDKLVYCDAYEQLVEPVWGRMHEAPIGTLTVQ